MTGQLARLAPGDVVLSGVASGLPEGICRKVTSVGEAGGRVVVETEPAALTDVIDQGEVAFNLHVTADDLADDGIRAPGVRIVREEPAPGTLPPALGGANGEGLHFTLTSTILGFAEGEGDIWLDPNAYCDWDIGWSGLNWASYTQELNATADLTLSCKQSTTGTKETTLYKRTLSRGHHHGRPGAGGRDAGLRGQARRRGRDHRRRDGRDDHRRHGQRRHQLRR